MKKLFTPALILFSILAFSTTTKAQGKIGYISADEIMAVMPESAKADTQLNQYQVALYQAYQEKQQTFNESVAKFYKDSSTMSPQLKEVKRTSLQQQAQELGGEEQRMQNMFEQERQRILAPIQQKLLTAIQVVAKENGYAYILHKESMVVMPDADNIAGLVKKKLGIVTKPRPVTPAGR
ncbi:hypothetical protein BH09BAC2_BH09BAC2_01160 [soil metagenome]